ncbi:MAG: hypothetical protein ACPG4U_00825 [Pseudomonadales bacterium]
MKTFRILSGIAASVLLSGCVAALNSATTAEQYSLVTDRQGWTTRSQICANVGENTRCRALLDGWKLEQALGSSVLNWADKARAENPGQQRIQVPISTEQGQQLLRALERDDERRRRHTPWITGDDDD